MAINASEQDSVRGIRNGAALSVARRMVQDATAERPVASGPALYPKLPLSGARAACEKYLYSSAAHRIKEPKCPQPFHRSTRPVPPHADDATGS